MSSHGFHDAEKAQCVIWVAEGHGYTASQRKFRTKYQKTLLIGLASVDGMNNTDPGEVIHTWVEMDVHRSAMKRKK